MKNKKIFILLLIIPVIIFFIGRSFSQLQEVKSVEIQSDNYPESGSWHITKSADWIDTNKARVTFDVNSIMKTVDGRYKDVILVIDVSGSMLDGKLDRAKQDAIELTEYILSDSHNSMALIVFDTTSEIETGFIKDKNEMLNLLNGLTEKDCTNYNSALQNVDIVMQDYVQKDNTDLVTLFLTDGFPNEDTPSQIATYHLLKDKYPYMTINGIQYEMGLDIIQEIIDITDNQWVADMDTLHNVLFDATVSSILYDNFIVTDYINDEYFYVNSIDDVNVDRGEVSLELENEIQKIIWNLGDIYKTGDSVKMTIDLTLKEEYHETKGFYPTNKSETVVSKLPDENEKTINSTLTPVLKNAYYVMYDTNTPTGCTLPSIDNEEHFVYQTIKKKTENPSCPGYLFKGWIIDDNDKADMIFINDDVFFMPSHDVHIKATWTKNDIVKKMDGTVHIRNTLYKEIKSKWSANGNSVVKKYTGNHSDSYDSQGTQDIYYYSSYYSYGQLVKSNNNVIFGNHCWQILRTTDSGGVKLLYNGEKENDQCLSSRANHIGYANRSTINLLGTFYYGTDYTYDKNTNKFALSGELNSVEITNDNAASMISSLKGKYTCVQSTSSGTCNSLYLIESYYNSAYAYAITINSNSVYNQFGNLLYNDSKNTLAYFGYMYGDDYQNSSAYVVTNDSFNSVFSLSTSMSFNTSYYYADSVRWTGTKYELVNPYHISSNEYSNMVGKYTFGKSDIDYSTNSVYFIINVSGSTMDYRALYNGKTDSTICLGDGFFDNGDGSYNLYNKIENNGTYSTTEPTCISLKDWYNNYTNYKFKYTCRIDAGSTCSSTNLSFITGTTYWRFDGYNVGRKILLAKSRNGLVLSDYITITYDEFLKKFNEEYKDYKYTCGNTSNVCTEENLIMIKAIKDSHLEYVFIQNYYFGESVEWDGTNYTLQNPIDFESIENINNILTHRYVCVAKGKKVCDKVAYIYKYDSSNFESVTDPSSIMIGTSRNIIILENGVETVEDALHNMFEKNTNDSIIKKGVDAWYKKYIYDKGFDEYIEDTVYCNNRSIANLGSWNQNSASLNEELVFNAPSTLNDLSCPKNTDRFSTLNNNAKLTYKVGIATAPEVELNYSSLTRTRDGWLMTPSKYSGGYAYMYETDYSGYLNNNYSISYNSLGVRPVISLIPDIEYVSGDGSMEHPYLIDDGTN